MLIPKLNPNDMQKLDRSLRELGSSKLGPQSTPTFAGVSMGWIATTSARITSLATSSATISSLSFVSAVGTYASIDTAFITTLSSQSAAISAITFNSAHGNVLSVVSATISGLSFTTATGTGLTVTSAFIRQAYVSQVFGQNTTDPLYLGGWGTSHPITVYVSGPIGLGESTGKQAVGVGGALALNVCVASDVAASFITDQIPIYNNAGVFCVGVANGTAMTTVPITTWLTQSVATTASPTFSALAATNITVSAIALFSGSTLGINSGALFTFGNGVTSGATSVVSFTGSWVFNHPHITIAWDFFLARDQAAVQFSLMGARGSSGNQGSVFRQVHSRGTLTAPATTQNGDLIAEQQAMGYASGAYRSLTYTRVYANAALSDDDYSCRHEWWAAPLTTTGIAKCMTLFPESTLSVTRIAAASAVRAEAGFNYGGTSGISCTYTTADSKTVTVLGGIIVSISAT